MTIELEGASARRIRGVGMASAFLTGFDVREKREDAVDGEELRIPRMEAPEQMRAERAQRVGRRRVRMLCVRDHEIAHLGVIVGADGRVRAAIGGAASARTASSMSSEWTLRTMSRNSVKTTPFMRLPRVDVGCFAFSSRVSTVDAPAG